MDNRAQKLWQRGIAHYGEGNMQAAQVALESLIARAPDSGPGKFQLSLVHARRGRFQAAIELARQALLDLPDRIEILIHLSRCHLVEGEPEVARTLATRALATSRDNPVVLDSLAVMMTRLDEQALALELFDQAITLDPARASLHYNRALAARQFGLLDAAGQDLESCLTLDPEHAKAHWLLATLRTQDLVSNHLPRLKARLDRRGRSSRDEELLALALFKELDDLSDVDGGSKALLRGLARRRERVLAHPRPLHDSATALIEICDQAFLKLQPRPKTGAAPVFVFGMPRSGAALLGNLLSRHSKIHHLGSQQTFSRHISRQIGRDSRRALDTASFEQCRSLDFETLGRSYLEAVTPASGKQLVLCESQPMNFQLAGFIAKALPGSRLLNMVRNPLDNCVSILGYAGGGIGLPSHDPADLAVSYLDYHRLMQHWHKVLPGQIMDVSYESLVEKPEMILRVICSFLGIRYSASLRTGLKLHHDRVGRGIRYDPHLPGLKQRLDKLS